MWSTKPHIFVIIVIINIVFVANSDGLCKKKDENKYECPSIAAVKEKPENSTWTELRIKNYSGGKEEIEDKSFEKVPLVENLIFEGNVKAINKNSFRELKKLLKIHFFNCDIPEIKSYAFNNPNVEELLIYTSNVRQLKTRCFDNLKNLKRIYIHKNSISTIRAGVFSYTKIEDLYLNENGIRTIEDEAFYGMEKLRTIALERNFLTHFDSSLLVGNTSPNLNLLWLARNNLTILNNDLLKPFPKLKILLIHINNIETVSSGTFNGINDLRYIDLSNNKLTTFNHRVFPWEGLERMDILFLQNNRLISLSTDVIAKLPRLRKIAFGGNPLLCPCYQNFRTFLQKKQITILCDDEYLDGQRPVCVSPEHSTDQCDPNSENPVSLFEFYQNAQMDYVKLPPLCKVYCTKDTSCYSHDFDVLVYN